MKTLLLLLISVITTAAAQYPLGTAYTPADCMVGENLHFVRGKQYLEAHSNEGALRWTVCDTLGNPIAALPGDLPHEGVLQRSEEDLLVRIYFASSSPYNNTWGYSFFTQKPSHWEDFGEAERDQACGFSRFHFEDPGVTYSGAAQLVAENAVLWYQPETREILQELPRAKGAVKGGVKGGGQMISSGTSVSDWYYMANDEAKAVKLTVLNQNSMEVRLQLPDGTTLTLYNQRINDLYPGYLLYKGDENRGWKLIR